MSKFEGIKRRIQSIPEFSEKNYTLAGYICAGLISITGALLIYSVLTHIDDLSFSANWNMFKSPFGTVCIFFGYICAIIFWGKMGHWSRTPIIEKRDRETGRLISRKEDFDVTEQLTAKWLMPLIGHFVIEPLIYAAIIYYPIQCIIAVIGAVFPYVLSLIVLALAIGSWFFTKKLHFRFHSLVLIVATVLFTVAFGLGSYGILSGNESEFSSYSNNPPTATSTDTTSVEPTTENNATDTAQTTSGEQKQTESQTSNEEEDNQFGGEGTTGLYASLSDGTTKYEGDMAGFPIEFTITKNSSDGSLTAKYKNVKYGTTMKLIGESLPAQDGEISFTGKDKGASWAFDLSGDADNIKGTAECDGKQLEVNLHKAN